MSAQTSVNEILLDLEKWSLELVRNLDKLGLVDSELVSPEVFEDCRPISLANSSKLAVRDYIRDLDQKLSLPKALIVLEHFRKFPSEVAAEIRSSRPSFKFSKTLAELSLKVGGLLHDAARSAFASAELDLAIVRFDEAAKEFLFALGSDQLSENGQRNAAGKYGVAVAISGRWLPHSSQTLKKALELLEQSIALGNVGFESVGYRLELLLQLFDKTGDRKFLDLIREGSSIHRSLEIQHRSLQAEARLRLSLLSEGEIASKYLQVGTKFLEGPPETGLERVRSVTLEELLRLASEQRLPLKAVNCSFPNGIAALMNREPSEALWELARGMISILLTEHQTRKSIPATIIACQLLRRIVEGPEDLSELNDFQLLAELSDWLGERVKYNRFLQWEAASAGLMLAKKTRDVSQARKAEARFTRLSQSFPSWPLPRVGLASAREEFPALGGKPSKDWMSAVELALESTTYSRPSLGGRNEVFAVADVRGFLTETFVFKPMELSRAIHEQEMLSNISSEILTAGLDEKFAVPRSLFVVETSDEYHKPGRQKAIHVTRRSTGRPLSEYDPDESRKFVPSIVGFIALHHRVNGSPEPGRTAWKPLKDQLTLWAKTILHRDEALRLVDLFRESFPKDLPIVRKRDAHPSNWIIDSSARIVAIDFEASDWVPSGLDVVQLIEDGALYPWNLEGWEERLALLSDYFVAINHQIEDDKLSFAYSWMALARALRNATDVNASKASLRNARESVAHIALQNHEILDPICEVLGETLTVNVNISKSSDSKRKNVRLSRAMSLCLRHKAPEMNVEMDSQGYVKVADLARALGTSEMAIAQVVGSPTEPRFEIVGEFVRALYGHSLPVEVRPTLSIGTPRRLFHGTSWEAIDEIVHGGLKPMGRQRVHLTNSVYEALAVAERKGVPLVVEVESSGNVTGAAEGIWTSRKVGASRISIVNSESLK